MCFKCHQKCLQTNSIILKLFSEKEVLIFRWHIQRQMDCKCTTFDKYKLSKTRCSRAFLLFVGTSLVVAGWCQGPQSVNYSDWYRSYASTDHLLCYNGAPPANSLWNEGLLTARYWCWVETCTRASNVGLRRFHNHRKAHTRTFSWLKAPSSGFTFKIF